MVQTIIAVLIVLVALMIGIKMLIKTLKNKGGACNSCSLKNSCSRINKDQN